ncbi:MAG: hypothetical protein JNM85_07275 [Chthonomonas sp.]|nr:hypothetical protein [Chthonomonas sp.]
MRFSMDSMFESDPTPKPEAVAMAYDAYWLPVFVSHLAQPKLSALDVLHASFRGTFERALLNIQETYRRNPAEFASRKIHVADLMPGEDVPEGIRFSYRVDATGLYIADLFTRSQHALFHVERTRR